MKREVELAKKLLESKGYRVSKKNKRLKESEEVKEIYYIISIDASTNAPGTRYTDVGKRVEAGTKILQSAGISDSNIEVATLGYDDITFIVKSNDKKYVDRVAQKIAVWSEEPSEEYRQNYDHPGDNDTVVTVNGPLNQELEDETGSADFWYR